MELLVGLGAGASFFLLWAGLTGPRQVLRPQRMESSDQLRLRQLRGRRITLAAAVVEGLAAWFLGMGSDDDSWRGGINRRYLQLLNQADWFWGPGEPVPPTNKDTPFWNLETLWAAKLLRGCVFGASGLALALAAVRVLGAPVVVLLLGLLAAGAGFFDPDGELKTAAEKRRRQLILEMGYKVPELRVYVRSGATLPAALRHLTGRSGGPFVQELYRVLQVYDITADVTRGLGSAMGRNEHCEPLVNLCGDLMAVLAEGGELSPVLEAHADAAQHEQRRLLRQQGQDNTQQMGYVVAASTLVVIFLLIAGPALWTVMGSLGGI